MPDHRIAIVGVLAAACGGGGSEGPATARIELSNDQLVGEPGLRPQLSPGGALVAFDFLYMPTGGTQPFYAVRLVGTNGTGDECLTCNRPEIPRSAGAPAFHPDGTQLVFSFEKGVHLPVTGPATDPGGGLFNDLAIYDLETDAITPIYATGDGLSVPSNGSFGALHPHFSHDGTKLVWADLLDGPSGAGAIFGTFRIGIGDYTDTPSPALSNVTYIDVPGVKLVVVSGFSLDDAKVYVQCKSIGGQSDHSMDIGEIDVLTGELVRLVKTSGQPVGGSTEPAAYEEHIAPIPRVGDPVGLHSFVLFSSLEHGVNAASTGLLDWVTTDLWSLDDLGNGPERLSSYNVAGSSQSDGSRAVVSKLGADHGGGKLVYSVWRVGSEASGSDDRFEIRVADIVRR